MSISKSKVSSIRRIKSGFAVTRYVIKRSAASVDPLQTGEEDQRQSGRGIDPSRFMNRKQKKAWKRLSPQKRKHYILMARNQASRTAASKGIAIKEKSDVFNNQGGLVDPETAKHLAGWKPATSSPGVMIRNRKIAYHKKKEEIQKRRRDSSGSNSSSYDSKRNSGQSGNGSGGSSTNSLNQTGSNSYGDSWMGTNQSSYAGSGKQALSASGGGTDIAADTTKTFSDIANTFEEAGTSSTGVGAAVVIAKKAAERFKEDLKKRTLGEQSIREQGKNNRNLNDSGTYTGLEKAGAFSIGAIATLVIQAAVQLVTSIMSVLMMILIPITIVAMIISLTISLLTSISGATEDADSYYMGGGMELVQVAIREIGYQEQADGTTKYGAWAGIGNANWCHAFVSWCANECGFIEEGVIPKTGACETGRQWFIKRNEYQEAGSYEPISGDIVYFRHGKETESHHVGIVEFAENGFLHTIEGNSSGMVKRREYPLNASRIMGYGTPAYPDDGYSEFGSGQDFLKEIERIGDAILQDGDWIYSNSSVKGSFTNARNASRHATNCAHAICMAMQEFGTLKSGQTFHADWSGNIICNNAVRKRINKYYDIINVNGKRNADGVSLKPGDICVWNIHVNVYAGTKKGKKVWYDFSKNCISDKKADSGTYIKYIRKGGIGQTLYKVLRLKNMDSYGSGKKYIIPKGMGTTYTYMGWALIHDWPTRQNYLRKRSGENYDSHGFAKVNGRYVIACTSTFGKVGDYIDFVLDNGKVIHAIMGDEKNQSDSGCNRWGHDNGRSVVEFVVNKARWYGHLDNRDITRFHPEWKSRVKMGVNLGKNFFGK